MGGNVIKRGIKRLLRIGIFFFLLLILILSIFPAPFIPHPCSSRFISSHEKLPKGSWNYSPSWSRRYYAFISMHILQFTLELICCEPWLRSPTASRRVSLHPWSGTVYRSWRPLQTVLIQIVSTVKWTLLLKCSMLSSIHRQRNWRNSSKKMNRLGRTKKRVLLVEPKDSIEPVRSRYLRPGPPRPWLSIFFSSISLFFAYWFRGSTPSLSGPNSKKLLCWFVIRCSKKHNCLGAIVFPILLNPLKTTSNKNH